MSEINISSSFCSIPIRVGIVGTGYAAKARAEALKADEQFLGNAAPTLLVTVAGHTPEKTEAFSQNFQVQSTTSWQQLVEREDLDLVIISTINRDHGAIARAALENDKHIIVEYPLSLDPTEAESLISLAAKKNKLLHVEHIELLGGLHNAIKQSLSRIGKIFYARYVTINSKQPAPKNGLIALHYLAFLLWERFLVCIGLPIYLVRLMRLVVKVSFGIQKLTFIKPVCVLLS
jgi:Predicted dehydrogenases and related proteins